MTQRNDHAVSPVVGVMLMLVVTIIIAAVVSAFAGSTASSQEKAPQALITGKFSVANGMEIIHTGGDVLSVKDVSFLITPNSNFGPNLEAVGTSVLNKQNMTDSKGNLLMYADGSVNVTSFSSGESLYVPAVNTTCNIFQTVYPYPFTVGADGYTWTGSGQKANFWKLCFRNNDNIGKTFQLKVVDSVSGNMISTSDVVITP